MITFLCSGDSNTLGMMPMHSLTDCRRHSPEDRWSNPRAAIASGAGGKQHDDHDRPKRVGGQIAADGSRYVRMWQSATPLTEQS